MEKKAYVEQTEESFDVGVVGTGEIQVDDDAQRQSHNVEIEKTSEFVEIVDEALHQQCDINEEIVDEALPLQCETEEIVDEALPQPCETEVIVDEVLLPQTCEIEEVFDEDIPQSQIEEVFDEKHAVGTTIEIEHDSRRIFTYWNQDRVSYYLTREREWLTYALKMIPVSMSFAVLTLPYAMSKLSLAYGVPMMVLAWIASLCTLRMLVVMHEVGPDRARLNSYVAIAEHAFGDGRRLRAVKLVDLLGRIFTNIVHLEVGGQCVQMFVKSIFFRTGKNEFINKRGYFIGMFGLLQCLLSLVPGKIYDQFRVKVFAFCCILSYCIIICSVSLCVPEKAGLQPPQIPNPRVPGGVVYGVFIAISQIAFQFSGHYEVAGVQKEIFSTLRRSRQPMWKGVVASYLVAAAICLPVAVIGCWRFGDGVKSDVVLSLEGPPWLLATTYMLVVLQLAVSCQVKAKAAIEQLTPAHTTTINGHLVGVYYMPTLLCALMLPLELGYMAIAGGLCNASISYLFPCLMWINIYKHSPRPSVGVWFLEWICVPTSALIIILSIVGGANDARNTIRHYELFH